MRTQHTFWSVPPFPKKDHGIPKPAPQFDDAELQHKNEQKILSKYKTFFDEYVKDHLFGRQPLSIAFLVNFIILTVLLKSVSTHLFMFVHVTYKIDAELSDLTAHFVLLVLLLSVIIINLWQCIGLFATASRVIGTLKARQRKSVFTFIHINAVGLVRSCSYLMILYIGYDYCKVVVRHAPHFPVL